MDSGIRSASLTLVLCTYSNQPGHEGFRGVTKDTDAVASPLVCSQDEPGPAEGTGKLLTAITRQRKLPTVKPPALKTETALEVWEDKATDLPGMWLHKAATQHKRIWSGEEK